MIRGSKSKTLEHLIIIQWLVKIWRSQSSLKSNFLGEWIKWLDPVLSKITTNRLCLVNEWLNLLHIGIMISLIQDCDFEIMAAVWVKGAFNNYVDRILSFFDPPPCMDSFITWAWAKTEFFDPFPPSSCLRSYWMAPK